MQASAVHEAAAAGAANATHQRMPRVYFLFLAVDKISNLGIWNNFFKNADPMKYRAFVHCKTDACKMQVVGSPLEVVPTVGSYYCTDLVSPMIQLVNTAISNELGDSHPEDKFAFVSDSTLPAKPFSHMYHTLIPRKGSDFCVFPSTEWADAQEYGHDVALAVKTHQWVTLDRSHAEKASALWAAGNWHNFMTEFKMNTQTMNWSNNTFADSRNWGCLDEFWHFVALFGTLKPVSVYEAQYVTLPGFVGPPLRIAASTGWQGTCDTFVIWSQYLHAGGDNPFERLHSSLDAMSVPHSGNAQRPGWWDKISNIGLVAIRNSDFLFVRKFIDDPTFVDGGDFGDAYSRVVIT